ncbi:MAG: PQQ-dependent sugar dehydrogenase [Candidatus Eremiobacteraeota bacterium]|nr:PQQ-dependent sugar dehydrogenase [Candidatus Eremiobacteraeota bacterium]
MKRLSWIGILIAASWLASCTSSSVPGPPTGQPAPGSSPTPGPAPPMALNLQSGFKITMISTQVPGARFMTFAPNGDLIVAETGNGKVVAIKQGAPVDSTPTVIASGLSLPHGLAFSGNDLYIATWTGLSVLRNYPSGTTVQTLYSGLAQNSDHNRRALAISSNGTVFESSGSDCNICAEGDPKLATVMTMDLNGQNAAIYAKGIRNGSGLTFDQSGQLWMTVNQRDDLTPDHTNLPVDEFDKLVSGGDYGWPQCYPDLNGDRQPNPDSPAPNPSCAGQVKTTVPLQAHSAPLGVTFYNGSMFPASFKGGAFIAYHGSWDRQPPTGYKIVFVPFNGGVPAAPADFVWGWLTTTGSYTGRPVGLAVAPDGSLYISDDYNGYIYRVTY